MTKNRHKYNRIKAWLALKQIKNKTLSEHLNVSETTISKWCTNYSQPSIPQLYQVADFLQISITKLLEPNEKNYENQDAPLSE